MDLIMDYRRKIIASSPHLSSASGAVASFSDGADLPLKSLLVDIEPVQSGTGDPSPDNVRPISGWNAVNVTRVEVNLWDEQWEIGSYNAGTPTVQKYTDTTHIRSKNPISVKPNTTYYMNSSGKSVHLIVADVNGNVLYRTISLNNGTFTTPSNGTFVYFNMAAAYGTTYNNDISINYPSTDHAYHPYNGVNVSIDLGQTVYGATINPLTGVMTVYPYYASYNGETLTGEWISDRDKYVAGTTPTIGAQVVDMSGTGTEIQLTPHQIRSLYGNNTIFADTGNVALEYWAHP